MAQAAPTAGAPAKHAGLAVMAICVDEHPSLGLQLSVQGDGFGWRIKGPKFAGTSRRLLTAHLDDAQLDELARWIATAKEARAIALAQSAA